MISDILDHPVSSGSSMFFKHLFWSIHFKMVNYTQCTLTALMSSLIACGMQIYKNVPQKNCKCLTGETQNAKKHAGPVLSMHKR